MRIRNVVLLGLGLILGWQFELHAQESGDYSDLLELFR